MKTQSLSRRAIAAGLALAPVAGLPASAGAVLTTLDPDPIIAAIERHRNGWKTFEEVCQITDEIMAKSQGREVTQEDKNAYEAANRAEEIDLANLLATKPTTKAGARAAIEHLLAYERGCPPRAAGEFAATLLRSPVLSD